MISRIIWCCMVCIFSFCDENNQPNQLNISALIENLTSIKKVIQILPDNDSIVLYKDDSRVIGISRISDDPSKEFHVLLPKTLILNEIPGNSHFDFYHSEKMVSKSGSLLIKNVADIFKVEYSFDQNDRIVKYTGQNQEIIFLNRKGYSRLNYQGAQKHSELLMRTRLILGTLDSFIIKGFDGKIILAVVDNKPYYPVLDAEGSLRKLIDAEGKEIASIRFSNAGHVVKIVGSTSTPCCFRGMFRERFSEIYFDENGYYDADLGGALSVGNSS